MKKTDRLADAVQLLLSILQLDIITPNDMISVISTGEAVVRLTHEAREDMKYLDEKEWYAFILGADLALRIYFRTLTKHKRLIPIDLDEDLEKALAQLVLWKDGRADHDADDTLRHIDQVLMVALAAFRTGRVKLDYVMKLASRALEVSTEVSTDVIGLWNEAESRACRIGNDPDYEFMTAWLEPIASFSKSRIALDLWALTAYRRGPKRSPKRESKKVK